MDALCAAAAPAAGAPAQVDKWVGPARSYIGLVFLLILHAPRFHLHPNDGARLRHWWTDARGTTVEQAGGLAARRMPY